LKAKVSLLAKPFTVGKHSRIQRLWLRVSYVPRRVDVTKKAEIEVLALFALIAFRAKKLAN